MKKLYGPIQQWVEWVGPQAIAGLKNLERSFTVTPSTLLEFRSLASPESAKEILPIMMKPGVTKKELDAEVGRVVHDMFVD